jgi:thiopurine S-methyltransferase
MQPDFWHDRWRTGQIAFHQTTVDSSLERLWPRLALGQGCRVFVPLAGKSLDLLWLEGQGHSVVGVELSAKAVDAFFMENGVAARRRARGNFDVYEAGNLELYRGDYFEFDQALLGDVAAVYDRAALISWTPESRKPYVEHLASLTRAGVQALLIVLEYPQPYFSIREVSRRDILASEPRLRSKGVTQLHEVCYHLIRS